MPEFEVDYSWQETLYGSTKVEAADYDDAERTAFNVLAASFDDEKDEDEDIEKRLTIESIREIKN